MRANGLGVIRIVFRTIEAGDRLKFEAKSNFAETGGGARDLRFRPETAFLPFFAKMFPHKHIHKRKTRQGTETIEVLSGAVTWGEGKSEKTATMEIWPATNARPNECRIAKVSSFGLRDLIQDDPESGKSVFMMFQLENGIIRIYFTTETSLKNDDWDPVIKKFTAAWLQDSSKSAFLDLKTMERYPHV